MDEVPEFELTDEQRRLSPEELAKDTQMRIAERLLQELDPGVTVEWVKADDFKGLTRRVIQMSG